MSFRLQTTAGTLRSALLAVAPAVARWTAYPIMTCALFDGRTAKATNLDIEIEVDLPAVVAEGTAAIDHRRLLALVRHIDGDEPIALEQDGECVHLRFSAGSYKLPWINPEAFPRLKAEFADERMLVNRDLGSAFRFCAPVIATEETRYYLMGVCLSTTRDGEPVAVGTDGHRMAVHPIGFADLGVLNGAIIPHDAVKVVIAMPEPTTIAWSLEPRHVRFTWAGMRLTTKLIEGTFPDWQRVVPDFNQGTPTLSLDRVDFDRRLLRLLGLVTTPHRDGVMVSLAFDRERAVLYGSAADIDGEGSERLACDGACAEPAAAVSFNGRYLRTLLGIHRGSERVRMDIRTDGGPLRVTSDQGGAFSILMPMRGRHGETEKAIATLLHEVAA